MPHRGPCGGDYFPQLLDKDNKLIDWDVQQHMQLIFQAIYAIQDRLCLLEHVEVEETTVTAPGAPSFTPALHHYGSFTFENISIANPESLIALHAVLVYVNEIKTALFATTTTSVDAVTDPVVLTLTVTGEDITDPELTFLVGDYVVWNDSTAIGGLRKYEIGRISARAGAVFTIQRALFGTAIVSHLSGINIYKAQLKHFEEALATPGFLPQRLDCTFPSVCVVSCLLGGENIGGIGPFTTVALGSTNSVVVTDNPPAPGFRTLAGDTYFIPQASATLAVATDAGVIVPSTDASSIRTIYAIATRQAPSGASIILTVKYRPPAGAWTNIETLTIVAGATDSFAANNLPRDRRMPYTLNWPPVFIPQNSLLGFDVSQIGSVASGAGLIVSLET